MLLAAALACSSTLTASVLDPAGAAASGVHVEVSFGESWRSAGVTDDAGRVELEIDDAVLARSSFASPTLVAWTDDAMGAASLRSWANDPAGAGPVEVQLHALVDLPVEVSPFPAGAALEVRSFVLDDAHVLSPGSYLGDGAEPLDDAGRARLRVPAGCRNLDLRGVAPMLEFECRIERVPTPKGSPARVDLPAPRPARAGAVAGAPRPMESHALELQLIGADPRWAAGRTIRLLPEVPRLFGFAPGGARLRARALEVVTDASGRARIDAIPSTMVAVQLVVHPDDPDALVTALRPEAPMNLIALAGDAVRAVLQLGAATELVGRVAEPGGLTGIPGVELSIVRGANVQRVVSDREGRFGYLALGPAHAFADVESAPAGRRVPGPVHPRTFGQGMTPPSPLYLELAPVRPFEVRPFEVRVADEAGEQPRIDRCVAQEGRIYLEAQSPNPRTMSGTPHGLPVTFRAVRAASPSVRATPAHAVEPRYRELEEGDTVLGVGVLPWQPDVAAIDDDGAHFAVARDVGEAGVHVHRVDGELVAAFDAMDLAQSGGSPVEVALPGRPLGAWSNAAQFAFPPPPSFPEHRLALWSEGPRFLLARVRPAVLDPQASGPVTALVELHRLDPATGTATAVALADLELPLAAAHVPRGAEILVELAAARGDRDALRAFARRTDVDRGARLRALGHVADEDPAIARRVAREALADSGAAHPLAVPYALALAARSFVPDDAPVLVQLVLDGRVAGHDEELLKAALERAEPDASERLVDALLDGDPQVQPPPLLVGVGLSALDASAPPELVERFLDGVERLGSTPRARSLLSGLAQSTDAYPTLAVASAVHRVRAAMASEERRYVYGLPQHRVVLAAIADGLESGLSQELEAHWVRQLVDLSDTRTPERTRESWEAWWSEARHRPQTAELVALAKAGRYGALRRGVEECLAAKDAGRRVAAATALASLSRERLGDASLLDLAEGLLDGWRPLDAAEQAARQRLREVLRGRPGGR